MTKILLTSAGLALAALAGTAQAAPVVPVQVVAQRVDDDRLTEHVSYRDLDLANASGQRQLTRRVRLAVRTVCAPLDGTNLRTKHQQCRSLAWHGAQPQIARAIERATQLASDGHSDIAEVAIAVGVPSAY